MGLIALALLLGAEPCAAALSDSHAKLSKIPLEQRVRPTLELIAENCASLDADLAAAAKKAAGLPRRERSAVLAAGQHACEVKDASAPAQSVVAGCPRRTADPQGLILRELDAGTYAFVVAMHQKLGGVDTALLDLALAVAHEAERERKK